MNRIGLFGRTAIPALRRVMDLSAWQQRASATNLAHADTPGYERRDVRFADELRRAGGPPVGLEVTHPAHIRKAGTQPTAVEVYKVPTEKGSRPVGVEEEMVALAESQLRFSVAARVAALRIQSLRASIRGQP